MAYHFKYLNRFSSIGWMIIILLVNGACEQPLFRNDLEAIKAGGELVVIMRNNAGCYYQGPDGPTGFEYDLVKAFAEDLGVRIRPLIIDDEMEMVTTLRSGGAHIIAAGFPFGLQAARLLALGPGYLEVRQQLVGRRGGQEFHHISELDGSLPIWITPNSGRLEILNSAKTQNPNIRWHTLTATNNEEMLQLVWNRTAPLTVVESSTMIMNQRFYPELLVLLPIGDPQKLAWAMHPQDRNLQRAVQRWFDREETQKLIEGLVDHYFSHLKDFDYVDTVRYRRRISSRLPKYQSYFEEAADRYGLDWHLVAAQSYQESHWNPRAKSYTGVRGMMMLTQETAKTLGLKNRLSIKESIFAGTRHMARLHERVGNGIREPDRTLMALAAYNMGFGHLKDAQELAARLGEPADAWHGIRAVLPLLQKKKYYRTLNHGYARGNEAVRYVDRIRTYHQILIMTPPKPDDSGS